MGTPQVGEKRQPPRHRIPEVFLIVIVVLAVCGVSVLLRNRANASRPQLEVRNSGNSPVMLRHEGNDLVVRPGDVGALRFSATETLTIFAGETENSKSTSVQLEKHGTHQGAPATPPRVAAEVNADDGENILFRYADGTEASGQSNKRKADGLGSR